MEIIDCNNAEYIWHQLKKDDTLNNILDQFNVTQNSIIRNNPNVDLYEGEVIKILKNTHNLHIVKPMETLDSVAKKYNTNIDDLVRVNNLSSKRLFIGQTLIIPKYTT